MKIIAINSTKEKTGKGTMSRADLRKMVEDFKGTPMPRREAPRNYNFMAYYVHTNRAIDLEAFKKELERVFAVLPKEPESKVKTDGGTV
jgi:hypothetical protein